MLGFHMGLMKTSGYGMNKMSNAEKIYMLIDMIHESSLQIIGNILLINPLVFPYTASYEDIGFSHCNFSLMTCTIEPSKLLGALTISH